MQNNPELELAFDFVKKTDRTIFLTGKAGTGKTTFLHAIKADSLKRMVVVAPTGVAAINAKGVTIHSFFQMPFGPILPEEAQTQNTKAQFQRKFNRTKIDLLRSLDLLIIDEISMVRADLLDGIDQVLRRYKDRTKVFGGAQVLMIGDLQQLSPVVKEQEWELLKPYYNTPYFFSSKAFQQCNPISIELKHIYRQDNEQFIAILNEIRNNKLSDTSAKALNQRFLPDFSPAKKDGYITLTTHNSRANSINNTELQKIDARSYFYKAEVSGKFPEYAYPTHENLELKKGAQVMFIKNDSSIEKRYYNGKIGTIVSLNKEEITVRCPGEEFDIECEAETWENVSYAIDKDTKEITENVSGSYKQIPLRLAWAITIHKSQGLTFEKAIIDAEASFAHGQTYVALSRCKTLEGIVLKSPIKGSSIINDARVASFHQNVEEHPTNRDELNESQKTYQLNILQELFNYYPLLHPVKRLIDIYYTNKTSIQGKMIDPLVSIKEEGITKLLKIGSGFSAQLKELSKEIEAPEKDKTVQERIKKAVAYFIKHTDEHIKTPLKQLTFSTENQAVDKDLKKQLKQLEDLLSNKLYCLKGLQESFSVVKYLELRAKAILQKSTSVVVKKDYTASTEHQTLFNALRGLRSVFADEQDVELYQIFTQKSLYEMCEKLPTTKKQLLAVNGMGKVRVQKYGTAILDAIQRYCDTNKIEAKEDVAEKEKPKKGATHLLTLGLFKEGFSLPEIAAKRGLAKGTIETHLMKFVSEGEIEITDVMPEDKYQELKKIMETTEFKGTSDLKNKIDPKFTYNEIRMVGRELENHST